MNKGLVRILRLAESISDAPRDGFTKSEIVDRTEQPASTVYRLLSEMEDAGYIYRMPHGRLMPTFSFDRRIVVGSIAPDRLRATCQDVSNRLQTASEIILIRGHNLLWHIIDEHPAQGIRLRAHPGFERTTYELDSISRLALAYSSIEELERDRDLAGFFEVGVDGRRVTWDDARKLVLAIDRTAMQFDMLGNAKGVRRYCVSICDSDGSLVCLLTAAEAATPVRDEEQHVARIRTVLEDARAALQATPADHGAHETFAGMSATGPA